MRKYQIKDLERLTGIKAHTIRIWEKRYNLLTPERTDTNIRYYQDDDLRKLLNVTLLMGKGQKISKLSNLSEKELYSEVQKSLTNTIEISKDLETFLIGLTIAMVELDEDKFNQIYYKSIHQKGFQHTITDLIYPFLVKIGFMWGVNEINPAQEHFVSNLIRQKMLAAINELPSNVSQKDVYVLYLPQNELHEIGLIMAHYLLKVRGYKVYYLGQDVPFDDLKAVVDYVNPSHIMTILTTFNTQEQVQEIHDTSVLHFKSAKLAFAGLFTHGFEIKVSPKVTNLLGAQDFIEYLS
ncbi:MAG: MerR family transcriptional regulator [Flavobacteriales bacterium]|nr:MerR family transcriptional regulator [Flavobacteriales bacterium]